VAMDTAPDHDCAWKTEAVALRAELAELRQRTAEVDKLKYQVEQLTKKLFGGSKSEKMPRPVQALKKRGDIAKQTPEEREAARDKGRQWRDDLPEVEVVESLPEHLEACPQCNTVPSHPLPPQVSYSYEELPSRMVRRKHVQPQVRCQCGSCIVAAPAPWRLYDKSQYGEQLCAHLIVAKCADAVAIERFARQLARTGVPVAASTLGALFHRCAELLKPLYDRLLQHIAAKQVVQADETRIQVQEKVKTRRAWVWTFLGDDLVAYVFSASRSGETPVKVLGASQGTLVVDGYTGYNQVTKPSGRERAGCLAHVRRELFDALKDAPSLQVGLDLILDVYKVEHQALAQDIVRTPAHAELRRTQSTKAMDALKDWLETEQHEHLPGSPAGKAIRYAVNQWEHLTVFLGIVGVPVDNNRSERMLRVIARGRSSYLFVGNDDAGQNLAMLMSLVLSAEVCGKNPQAYIADVLLRTQTHPMSRIDELLPHLWQPQTTADGA
jgi:transposase